MTANGRDVSPDSKCKFILVSGGVISGIGKGLTASSIGVLMKACGWEVTAIKIDPYLNIDAGTMSPAEHGEVFVLHDGGEVDLDLGNYERFLDTQLSSDNNITTGKIYQKVLTQEREGKFLGKTVQVVPHITDTIKSWITEVANRPNPVTRKRPKICVIELGGTVGDIESMPFIEALRQLRYEVGDVNFCSVFVSLVPSVGDAAEQKTKPTQHGVKNLRSQGLSPNMIVCRSATPLREDVKSKLAMFCQVSPENVIGVHDVSNTYNIPLMLQEQGVCNRLIYALHLNWTMPLRLWKWEAMARTAENSTLPQLTIGIVGKYTTNSDAYLSIIRALQHATMALGFRLSYKLVESEDLLDVEVQLSNSEGANNAEPRLQMRTHAEAVSAHQRAWEILNTSNAILVPGGFGNRGTEGKILAVKHALKTKKPYLGICLGMQMAVVECVREVFNEPKANSSEFDRNTPLEAIIHMPESCKKIKGGTMRLGIRKTIITDPKSVSAMLYEKTEIMERHRHRYEVNPELIADIEKKSDMRFVGKDETGTRMEILERTDHPFFLGTQYHPEFESHPGKPSPVFVGFIMAAANINLDSKTFAEKIASVHAQNPWSEQPANGSTAHTQDTV